MSLHGKNFIAGQLSTGGGNAVPVTSPLNRATLEPAFYQASEREVDQALASATQAFETLRETTGDERAALLERIADEITALGDTLIRRAQEETGLPEARLTGERGRTTGQLRLFAAVVREGSWVDARIDTAIPDRQPVPKPDVRRMLGPIGPVIVFGSSNFPLAFSVAGGDTASALATGNPVVVKAHSGHPGTSELVAGAITRALDACGLPNGVFSMLHGPGKVVGMALVRHPATRAVGFTGSREAGRALFDAAAARPDPIPVFAEMSSLNPVFILPRAMKARGAAIADGLRTSVTMGVGQFCTKPGLVFGLDNGDFQTFADAMADLIEAVSPATMLHGGIADSYHAGLQRASSTSGVAILATSADRADVARTHGEAVVARTTVSDFATNHVLSEEVFGPFTLLIGGATMAELESAARKLEGQLTATVHGTPEDLADAAPLLRILEQKAGRVIINGFPTGVEVCPSMHHGGPYPATTDVRFTSVGTAALYRFVRPICYQGFPEDLLPEALKTSNPLGIRRTVNGRLE